MSRIKNKTRLPLLLILMVMVWQLVGCMTDEMMTNASYQPELSPCGIIVPSKIPSGSILPVIVCQQHTNPRVNQEHLLSLVSYSGADFGNIFVKRGMGSCCVNLRDMFVYPDSNSIVAINILNSCNISVNHLNIQIIENPTRKILNGVLSGLDLIWTASDIVYITADATVPSGAELVIEPGAIVELGRNVKLNIEGRIECNGTVENPVIFTSDTTGEAWGEINHISDHNSYSYTFFVNGGGDPTRSFGHSGSQAVLRGSACEVSLRHAYIMDNVGKALGFLNSVIQLDSCLISRCDTGGELSHTLATVRNTYFLDMPNSDHLEVDDDNDCIYLVYPWVGGDSSSVIENCVFVTGKDDGIDHNGANVIIRNCVLDGFDNEGIATSNQNKVFISNTMVVNCEQGIEAGYGSPEVYVDHCLLMHNETGLRFGDWYNNECLGSMTVTNTISVSNSLHNVWNWVKRTNAPKTGAINVSYSMVNTAEYNSSLGCLTGRPAFTIEHLLVEGSDGVGAGSDSLDMGLLQ